jgi:hydrogenase maturation protein HypF
LNLTHIASCEGEAAVHLEMNANENISEEYDIKLSNSHANGVNNILANKNKTGVIVIDDFYILQQIVKDIKNKIYADVISAKFHNTLAKIILIISKKVKDKHGIDIVTLSGGVFQNNYLLKKCYDNLQDNSFKVYSNFKVPVNDGGISLGQAYIAAKSL